VTPPETARVLAAVASVLYELARVGRHDVDSTFVSVRRSALAELAAQLMATQPKGPK